MKILTTYKTFEYKLLEAINIQDEKLIDKWFKACLNGDLFTINRMLKNGFDVNTKYRSNRAGLHAAAANNRANVIKTLLAAGADINVKNINGLTPIEFALLEGSIESIKILVKADSNLNNLFKYATNYVKEWLKTENAQRFLIKNKPLILNSFEEKGIPICQKIKDQYPHLFAGMDLNLL